MSFEIVTDSSCNLPDEYINKFDLHIIPLRFMSDNVEYQSYEKNKPSDLKKFYTMMREGKIFTTSLPSQKITDEIIRSILDEGKDLLYIGFSSGLSGTFEATTGMLESLRLQYPERKIFHTDTRAASLGEGLLVYKAALKREDGESIEQVHSWIEAKKFNLAHWFTVDDLMYLFRGGRVSRTSALAGSLLNIKPVLHMDNAGHLIPVTKVRGRKKSLNALIAQMEESALQPIEEQEVFISHGDCIEDANYLADKISEKFGCKNILINYVDPVIGAHSGPGTISIFFMADKR